MIRTNIDTYQAWGMADSYYCLLLEPATRTVCVHRYQDPGAMMGYLAARRVVYLGLPSGPDIEALRALFRRGEAVGLCDSICDCYLGNGAWTGHEAAYHWALTRLIAANVKGVHDERFGD